MLGGVVSDREIAIRRYTFVRTRRANVHRKKDGSQ